MAGRRCRLTDLRAAFERVVPLAGHFRVHPPEPSPDAELKAAADLWAEQYEGGVAATRQRGDDGRTRTSRAGVATDRARHLARLLKERGRPWAYRGCRWEAGPYVGLGDVRCVIEPE